MQASRTIAPRTQFLQAISGALRAGEGFAAGKISISHIIRLNYSRIVARQPDAKLLRAIHPHLIYHNLNQQGIFPPDADFYLRYNEFYAGHLRALDYVGVFPDLLERTLPLLDHFSVHAPLLDFRDLEPDRSLPDNPAACYLPLLRDKRLLIICPFANLLAARANSATFEGVWSKTGKRWPHPASVEGLKFPYGFLPATQARYDTTLALYDEIVEQVSQREFDVALIAAAGLAIPLAATIKRMGRVAIDLGGHLQVLFGVTGKRWREQEEWRQHYFNDWWIDMPEHYRPDRTDVCDNGAYW